MIDGVTYQPQADHGFEFNPGQIYNMPIPPAKPPEPVDPVIPPPVVQAEPAPAVIAPAPTPINIPLQPARNSQLKHPKNLVKYGARSKNASAVSDAMEAINNIHSVPDSMEQLDIQSTSSPTKLGAYVYSGRTNKPFKFRLSTKGDNPRMTMVHEMGHYLDHHGIGTKGAFDSESGDRTSRVIQAIKQSKSYSKLAERRAVFAAQNNTNLVKHVDYLMGNDELFARSYAQFIASKSTGRKIKGELKNLQEDNFLGTQWDDEDFQSINVEMGKLFSDLGWSNQ